MITHKHTHTHSHTHNDQNLINFYNVWNALLYLFFGSNLSSSFSHQQREMKLMLANLEDKKERRKIKNKTVKWNKKIIAGLLVVGTWFC